MLCIVYHISSENILFISTSWCYTQDTPPTTYSLSVSTQVVIYKFSVNANLSVNTLMWFVQKNFQVFLLYLYENHDTDGDKSSCATYIYP